MNYGEDGCAWLESTGLEPTTSLSRGVPGREVVRLSVMLQALSDEIESICEMVDGQRASCNLHDSCYIIELN